MKIGLESIDIAATIRNILKHHDRHQEGVDALLNTFSSDEYIADFISGTVDAVIKLKGLKADQMTVVGGLMALAFIAGATCNAYELKYTEEETESIQ